MDKRKKLFQSAVLVNLFRASEGSVLKARCIKIILRAAFAGLFCLHSSYLLAGEKNYPWDQLPGSFIGMQTGKLQPPNTVRIYGGEAQTSRKSSGGQTGRQTYVLGVDVRGHNNWQIGATTTLFDDEPAQVVAGSFKSVTQFGAAGKLKYQFFSNGSLHTSLLASAEWSYFSRGAGVRTQSSLAASEKSASWMWTVGVPVTLRLTDRAWLNGEVAYTDAPKALLGSRGFGDRVTVSVGAAYQLSERIFSYGSVKYVSRMTATALDAEHAGSSDFIYTLGAQYAMTPQAALNLYVTNAFSQSPVGDDLLFYPDKNEPVLGAVLNYVPSGMGVGEKAATYWIATRPKYASSRFVDGFTINSPHTLASDRIRTRCTTRSDSNWSCSAYYAPDPDFQFEFSVEDYALREGSNFRSAAIEGTRYLIGGRWQAMDEAYGQPFSLGFGLSGGRDVSDPQLGVLFADANLSKSFSWGELGFNGRAAAYGAETVKGFGFSTRYDLSNSLQVFGEVTGVYRDDVVWAGGLRWQPRALPISFDIFTSNAAGLSGVGSLLSNDQPALGLSIHFEHALDLL